MHPIAYGSLVEVVAETETEDEETTTLVPVESLQVGDIVQGPTHFRSRVRRVILDPGPVMIHVAHVMGARLDPNQIVVFHGQWQRLGHAIPSSNHELCHGRAHVQLDGVLQSMIVDGVPCLVPDEDVAYDGIRLRLRGLDDFGSGSRTVYDHECRDISCA